MSLVKVVLTIAVLRFCPPLPVIIFVFIFSFSVSVLDHKCKLCDGFWEKKKHSASRPMSTDGGVARVVMVVLYSVPLPPHCGVQWWAHTQTEGLHRHEWRWALRCCQPLPLRRWGRQERTLDTHTRVFNQAPGKRKGPLIQCICVFKLKNILVKRAEVFL